MVGKNTDPLKLNLQFQLIKLEEIVQQEFQQMIELKLLKLCLIQTQNTRFSKTWSYFSTQSYGWRGTQEEVVILEAAIDLCKLAGLKSAGIIVEIMNDDGTMARLPELFKIAKKFKIKNYFY